MGRLHALFYTVGHRQKCVPLMTPLSSPTLILSVWHQNTQFNGLPGEGEI